MVAPSSEIVMVNCYTYSGAEIGLFCANSYITFQGLVQFKVIAGLVKLFGHTFQPSALFYDAYPLSNQFKMTAVSADQATTLKQKDYAVAINSLPLVFRQARNAETLGKAVVDLSGEDCLRSLYVEVELNQTDCAEINNLVLQYPALNNVCAIVIFRELRSNIVEVLLRCFPIYCHGGKAALSTAFKASKKFIKGGSSQKSLEMPLAIEKAISSLIDQKNLMLMVMGTTNTGKSTLARYTVNSLLNHHKRVAFLECDVGQTEFTPPGVVSITFISHPLIGPPCTHQQSPERAYFIGSNSPMQDPDLYICCVNSLMQYFVSQKEPIPLIVNTCGWLRDLGTCLFWDLLRLISPTHIIHLLYDCQGSASGFQDFWFRKELALVNVASSHHSFGWLLTSPSSCDQLYPSPDSHDQPCPLSEDVSIHRDNCENPLVQIGSPETTELSTDEFTNEFSDSSVVAETLAIPEISRVTTAKRSGKTIKSTLRKVKFKRLCNKRKKRIVKVALVHTGLCKGKSISKKFHHRAKLRTELSRGILRTARRRHNQPPQGTSWKTCGLFQLFSHLITNHHSTQTSAKVLREISMAVYFAHLNDETSSITPWPKLILTAVPYEIKWHHLAVHCLIVEVPRSQILCAINGMVVGLTRVDPSIIVDFDDSYPGMVKFLTERTPMAEYIGYGLVRGVDMREKLFYITTPEPLHRLEHVNCLMIGKNELQSDVYTCNRRHCDGDTQPYVSSRLPSMAIVKPFRERQI